MDFDRWITAVSRKAHPALIGVAGAIILLAGYGGHYFIRAPYHRLQSDVVILTQAQEQSEAALNHYQTLAELKTQDVLMFKETLSNTAQSKKTLFEAGLSTQEERRLLEKQWEIMTTYLTIEIPLQRVFLMRGDQPLESYLMNYVPLKAFGGLPTSVPNVARIVSKERFANPERGKSELINGKLQWTPPQVGSSVRSNALGEYVIFTNSRIILHGPPRNVFDHEAFPHLCLGLSLDAARNLYRHSFIGTKIRLTNVREEFERQSSFAVNIATPTAPPTDPNGN